MKKKIGCVIAFRKNHNNYGTSLVGHALLKKLLQLGFDVEVINYVKNFTLKEKIDIAINQIRVLGIRKFLGKKLKNKPANISYVEGTRIRTKAVNEYKDHFLQPFFHNYVGYDNLRKGSKNYDVVVVGSDQVWLPLGLKTKFFNLLFVDDSVRKVAYAFL